MGTELRGSKLVSIDPLFDVGTFLPASVIYLALRDTITRGE
jgi:hypothetical protein